VLRLHDFGLGWDSEPRFSYAGSAPLLEKLAQALQSSKKVR